VLDETGIDPASVVGDECHIASQGSQGPRAGSSDLEMVDEYENLLLLCKVDHKRVDDQPNFYTPVKLRAIKEAHEAWVHACLSGQAEPHINTEGWAGLELHGCVFAWEGPLIGLDDRAAEPEPPGLIDALRQNSLQPSWARRDQLPRHRSDGTKQVFATDRRTWRRAIIDGDTVLVESGPAESPEQRAVRIERQRAEQSARHEYFQSPQALRSIAPEITRLHATVARRVESVSAQAPSLSITFRKTPADCLVRLGRYSAVLAWRMRFENTLQEAELHLTEYDGVPYLRDDVRAVPDPQARELRSEIFLPDFSPSAEWSWKSLSQNRSEHTTEQLAAHLIEVLLERTTRPPDTPWAIARLR